MKHKLILVGWLYATLVLAGRRSGYILILSVHGLWSLRRVSSSSTGAIA